MVHRSTRWAIPMGSDAVCAIAPGDTCRAGSLIIPSGYDLTTFSSVSLGGLPAIGVSLQSFDFGPPIGTQDVGNSSYIDRRLSGGTLAAVGDGFQTAIAGLALAVRTLNQVNFSLFDPSVSGMGYVYVTFTTPSATTPVETITRTTETGGAFTADYTASLTLHAGALDGPVLATKPGQFTTTDGTWTSVAPPGVLAIPGVNDGFYVTGATNIATGDPNSFFIQIAASAVPEPSTLALSGVGFLVLMAVAAYRAHK
jgi:PEP-CTERM motif